MKSILYIFITCKSRFDNCYNRIIEMMKNFNYNEFIIIKGGSDIEYYDIKKHILNLVCNDYYEGLPEKVIKTLTFIYNTKLYNKYKYICKVDDDIIIKKIFTTEKLPNYCGKIFKSGNRSYHIGRCSENSKFNNIKYTGKYVPFCAGGYGYIVSIKLLEFIVKDEDYKNEIFEDLYIAKILYKYNTYPKDINITDYLYSKDHCSITRNNKNIILRNN